jgi:hypothetical protein
MDAGRRNTTTVVTPLWRRLAETSSRYRRRLAFARRRRTWRGLKAEQAAPRRAEIVFDNRDFDHPTMTVLRMP